MKALRLRKEVIGTQHSLGKPTYFRTKIVHQAKMAVPLFICFTQSLDSVFPGKIFRKEALFSSGRLSKSWEMKAASDYTIQSWAENPLERESGQHTSMSTKIYPKADPPGIWWASFPQKKLGGKKKLVEETITIATVVVIRLQLILSLSSTIHSVVSSLSNTIFAGFNSFF